MSKRIFEQLGVGAFALSIFNSIFVTSFGFVVLHSPIADAQTPPQTTTVCTNIGGSTSAEAQVICIHAGTQVIGRAPAPDYYFTFGNQLPDLLEAPPTPPYLLTYNLGPGAMGGGIKCPCGYRCTVSWTADGYQITSDLVPKISQNDNEWAQKFWQRFMVRAGAGPALAGTLAGVIALAFGFGSIGGLGVSEATLYQIPQQAELQMIRAQTVSWLALRSGATLAIMEEMFRVLANSQSLGFSPFGDTSVFGYEDAIRSYQDFLRRHPYHVSGEVDNYGKVTVIGGFDGLGYFVHAAIFAEFNGELPWYNGWAQYDYSYGGRALGFNSPLGLYNNAEWAGNQIGIRGAVELKTGSLLEVAEWMSDNG